MAKKDDTVEPTVTFNRKKLVTAGWIAGGVLAIGATFAAGAAIGHITDGPRGGDFVAGQTSGPGHDGPERGHGNGNGDADMNLDGPGHGPRGGYADGDRDGDRDHDGMGMGGKMAPPAPIAPGDGSTTPAPTTTP